MQYEKNKKSSANDQNLSSPILATMFLLQSPEGATQHDRSRSAVLV